jgi:hypothetical protein
MPSLQGILELLSDFSSFLVCEGDRFENDSAEICFPPNFHFTGVENLANGSFCSMKGDPPLFPGNESSESHLKTNTFCFNYQPRHYVLISNNVLNSNHSNEFFTL